jgi:hypothetical protein
MCPFGENSGPGIDHSPSGKEWGWVCGALEAGVPAAKVYAALLQRAAARRGPDAQRYAPRTVQRALQHTGLASLHSFPGP